MRAVLRSSYREVQVQIPVRLATARIHVFSGYRVQHNGARGPYKGGVRYHPEVDLDEVRALAMLMTLEDGDRRRSRSAARRAASTCRPRELDARRAGARSRARSSTRSRRCSGPTRDIPAPDVEHQRPGDGLDDGRVRQAARPHAGDRHRQADRARRLATGARRRPAAACVVLLPRGGAGARPRPAEHARRRPGLRQRRLAGRRGSSPSSAARSSASPTPTARSTPRRASTSTALRRARCATAAGCRSSRRRRRAPISAEELLGARVRRLHPRRARRHDPRRATPTRSTAALVARGRQRPTTPAADEILADKGVHVVPDVLANAGGVVVSYFEWVQNLQHFRWDEREVNDKLGTIMRRAYREVARARRAGRRAAARRRLRARHRARRRGGADARLHLGRASSRVARRPVRATRSKRTLPGACPAPCG